MKLFLNVYSLKFVSNDFGSNCAIIKNKKMQTLTIDILNKKAVKLLKDLELLQLIRVRKEKQIISTETNWAAKYKGAMSKQPLNDIDNQLNELRNEWE